MVETHLSSLQNNHIKRLLQLQEKSRNRRKERIFPVEGFREIRLALKGDFKIAELYYCEELIEKNEILSLLENLQYRPKVFNITAEVYQKVAYRGSTEGCIALFEAKQTALKNLHYPTSNPLLLVAEAPEKPGNIGALLRTADAAGIDAVLIANPKTDLFNPNIIRSSVGCVFTNQVATGSSSEIISYLKKTGISIYAAALQVSEEYQNIDFTEASAIVVGTEATGLSKDWLENSNKNIHIAMSGEIDSMNVSVAAGILIFEAKRQRRVKNNF